MATYNSLTMIRDDLEHIPSYSFPEGFSLRLFEGNNDRKVWIETTDGADPFQSINAKTFKSQFKENFSTLRQRMFFVLVDTTPVGSCTAWYDENYHRPELGRIHWLSILPNYQGRGLAKATLSHVLTHMITLGITAGYLVIDSRRIPAISLYLSFGFKPWEQKAEDPAHWAEVNPYLKPPRVTGR